MRKNSIYFFFTLFLALFQINALTRPNNFTVENYTSDEGLSHNNVDCIVQDATGFLWIGTHDGLNRFDGFSFKTYFNNPNDSTTLGSGHIESLLVDKQGELWIGTLYGLDKYNKKNDRFIHIAKITKCHDLMRADIKAIIDDEQGNIWIGTYGNGLFKFNPHTLKITNYLHDKNNPESIYSNYIDALFQDKPDNLYIGTFENGLIQMNINTGAFKQYNTIKNASSDEGITIISITRDKNKKLLLDTWSNGLCIFNTHSECIEKFPLLNKNRQLIDNTAIISVLIDHDGSYWISTFFNGLVVYDPVKNDIINFRNDRPDSFYIKSNTTWAVLEDRYGVKWIGTYGGGIAKIVKNNTDFIFVNNSVLDKGKIRSSNSNITSLCATKDQKILVGTAGGEINIYSKTFNAFEPYLSKEALGCNSIFSIIEDRNNNLWIGSDKGVELYNTKIKTPPHINPSNLDKSQKGKPKQMSIVSMCIDSAGWIWLGSFDVGLFKYNPVTGICKQYIHDENDPQSISNNVIWSICKDYKNDIWIGTRDLLNRYDRLKDNFIHYVPDSTNLHSISHNVISFIYEDSKKNIWIATLGNGINKYIQNKDDFERINVSDGLLDNSIFGIEEDSKGNLWLSSIKGLSKYNPQNGKIENFDKSSGLRNNLFNMGVCLSSRSGELYFGGINGLNVFNPDSIHDFNENPQIVLTDFKLFNKSVPSGKYIGGRLILPRDINEIRELNLQYNDYVISFEFSVLDFAFPKSNEYAYMLEGFDKEWVFTSASRRFANYTNLAPGKYIFKVKATNHRGIWNKNYKSLVITISPPYWETLWFKTLLFLGTVLLIYLFISYRIRQLRNKKNILQKLVVNKTYEVEKQNEILENKNQELSRQKEEILEMTNKIKEADERKMKFFTNISHELRTPLTLILGPADNLLKNQLLQPEIREQVLPIFKNANRLLRLINELLDFQKLDNDTLRLMLVENDIVKFLSEIVHAFDTYATNRHIDLYYIPEIQEYKTLFDPSKIEIILYNLLSNALKFTNEGGKIKVSLLLEESTQQLQIVVQDNGIGIEESKIRNIFNRYYQIEDSGYSHQGAGIGLALTKEIIDLMDGTIVVNSEINSGTAFTIKLPILTQESVKINARYNLAKEAEMKHDEQLNSQFITNVMNLNYNTEENGISHDRILVIDDNDDLRSYIRNCLKDKYTVYEASNGKEGLIMAQNKQPVLIISDIMMPEMSGLELCMQLKSNLLTSHIPVILLTAKTSEEAQIEGYKSGADDYITKPFHKDLLLARIQNLIESRQKLRKIFKSKIDFEPSDVTLTTADEKFLIKAFDIVEKNIGEMEFGASELVAELGYSRTMVHIKLKELTNSSASEFIRNIRLKRAYQILKQNKHRINEICDIVGFSDPNYFSKSFKKMYGVSPAKFAENPF